MTEAPLRCIESTKTPLGAPPAPSSRKRSRSCSSVVPLASRSRAAAAAAAAAAAEPFVVTAAGISTDGVVTPAVRPMALASASATAEA
jgi:hypothetical protein